LSVAGFGIQRSGRSPYRAAVEVETLEAATRDGPARLDLGPRHVRLQVGDDRVATVSGSFLSLVERGRRRVKQRSVHLDPARLAVASAHPTRELGLWLEAAPDRMVRLLGVRPLRLLDDAALAALLDLEKLARRLVRALAPHGFGGGAATELGRGQHRVLLIDCGDRLILYARPIFRERQRRILEVAATGALTVHGRGGDRRAVCRSRFAITAGGDRIRFCDPTGVELAAVYLPWISPEDREELACRFGEMVERGSPSSNTLESGALTWPGPSLD
jgi:hypothetical protein